MKLDLLINIIDLLGEIMIAITVIRVHNTVVREHKIDKDVLKSMSGEKRYAIIGILLIALAFALRLITS